MDRSLIETFISEEKMKKIWIINHYAEPPEGGKYLRHFIFAKKLIERGYQVKIISASTIHNTDINNTDGHSPYIEKLIDGVPFVFVKTRSYFGNTIDRIMNILDYYFGVKKIYKKLGKADVIYTSGPHPFNWRAARYIKKKTGAKFIVETRDLWPETFVCMGKLSRNNIIARILYAHEKSIYKSADKLIFTMPLAYKYLEKIGVDISKFNYINNGIDIEEFNKKISEYKYYSPEYSDFKGFKLVFPGAMGNANGVEKIVEAADIVNRSDYRDIRFYLFGNGTKEEELKKIKEDKKIDNLYFMGKVDKKFIPSILSQADVNILTHAYLPELYKYGISPNKIFEYYASGKPIISNVECGFDLVEEYKCGRTVKPLDGKYIAEAVLDFYNMPKEKYDYYSHNALEAAKKYDFEILTDKLVEVIES